MINKLTSEQIEAILSRNYIAYLACSDENIPYIVPITYYYDQATNSFVSYTTEGKKIKTLRKNPKISIIVPEIDTLTHWSTIILEGEFEELTGSKAISGIQLLSTKLTRLINEKDGQHVTFINDMARINEENPKVIYRIHLKSKSGRFEDE